MMKKTPLMEELDAAQMKAQYDEYAKRILSYRVILAWILKYAVEECRESTIEEIMECIEPDIQVSSAVLNPGKTNSNADFRIVGNNVEDKIPGEGEITFDIRFGARIQDTRMTHSVKLLINVEAQKEFYEKYSLVTRGIFYGARMISAQLHTEFQNSDYDNIKKVYSIWICMKAPLKIGNAMSEFCIGKRDIIGHMPLKKKNYDKLSVVMVCMNEQAEYENGGLHRLLNTLFSQQLSLQDKARILSAEYGIAMERELKEVVRNMCNLSEAIEEQGRMMGFNEGISMGISQGISQGVTQGLDQGIKVCVELCKNFGLTREQTISEVTERFSKTSHEAEAYVKNYWT